MLYSDRSKTEKSLIWQTQYLEYCHPGLKDEKHRLLHMLNMHHNS